MITAARPIHDGPAHYYTKLGEPVWSMPNKSKPGESRSTTVKDARALGLVPSPTTVLKLLHRHALVEWLCEQACLAVLTTPRIPGEELDAFVTRVLHTDKVQDEERDAAAQKGKAIHKAIQDAFAMIHPALEMAPFVIPAHNAMTQLGRVVATEKVITGDGYCGMTDCVLENDSEIWVADFKTCRVIPAKPYDEQALQVSAYCGGLGNTGNKRIRGMLVYVSTTTPGEIKVVECLDWQADYERFRLLLNFWKKTNKLS